MAIRYWPLLTLILLIASCSSTKNAVKDKDAVTVNLDTINVTASRENPYRGSATKYFDLVHTKLYVSFDYAKQYLYGKAIIILHPHFYPQSELILDAKQFDIHELSVINADSSHTPLDYTYDSSQLRIKLNRTYNSKEQLKLFIDYTAKPEERKIGGSAAISEDKGLYFINPTGKDSTKPIQIWTQGETESNSCWFPTIDKPDQKTTDEIYITHLKKYVSLSNGVLVSTTDNGDSTVTDYWRMGLPHAPYLFMMAIGDFAIVKSQWRDVPVNYYVEHKYAPYAQQIFGNTPEMIEFFSQKLGFDFPWPKYSQVVVRDYVSGAMENTSATLHGEFLNRDSRELLDETFEDVISHELFHQWFGDLVTCESWSNIPLNESFATYGEYLWNEYKYGKEYADYKQLDNYEKFMEEAQSKNVDLIRFHYNDREDMFDRHSYEKGGLVLNYLRSVVGDEAFFKSLELYLKTNQFKPVEIHQLRLVFEEVTGRDMNWFFNEWFLDSGYPELAIHYSYDADSVYVSITQKQNTGRGLIYTLPMKVAVHYGNTVNTYPIELSKKSQIFSFKGQGIPDLIDADADRVVLCSKTENKSIANYIFQYKNSPLFVQRYEALVALSDSQKISPDAQTTIIAAIHDPFFDLRELAIQRLQFSNVDSAKMLTDLTGLAVNDSNSHVRTAAIQKISKIGKSSDFTQLFETAIGDSSYMVAGAALKELISADSKRAMYFAKQFENQKNPEVAAAVADVYSKEGDADYQNYFKSKLESSTGIAKYYLFYYYANFLTRMDKSVALTGIEDIANEAQSDDSHFILGAGKGSLKRIAKNFEAKKNKAESDLAKEKESSAKLDLQETISNYDAIVAAANSALERLNKSNTSETH